MKKLINFIINCWTFRKELTEFQTYDYSYNLQLLVKSLELTKETLKEEYTNEETLAKMERIIELIHRMIDGDDYYNDLAEQITNIKLSKETSHSDMMKFYGEVCRQEQKDMEEFQELIPEIKKWWT